MRENEAGRLRVPWRSHPWFKRISSTTAQVAAAMLLATGVASSLAARKKPGRDDDRDGNKNESAKDRDRDGGRNRDRDDKRENDRREDRDLEREKSARTNQNDDRRDRERQREREDNEATADEPAIRNEQKNNRNKDDEPRNNEDPDAGGGGGGGGNNAGNAGSGFFDSPLATKARRRSNDFDNRGGEAEDDGIFVDVDPEGESIFETDSISFITGPEGVEILTGNITYFAEPTPTPTPLPRLELPVREDGFPFGEDFPFGESTVTVAPTSPEPSDPGDTPVLRPDPAPDPAPDDPPPADSDGGDNTMDFTS